MEVYAARESCGCVKGLASAEPKHARTVSQSIAVWEARKLTVELMESREAHRLLMVKKCPHTKGKDNVSAT